MAKLTKRQASQLKAIRANVERAAKYLQQDKVVGIAVETDNPLGNSYTIRNPACLETTAGSVLHINTLNKHIGSDIAGLYEALRLLNEWSDNPELKIKTMEL